MESKSNTTLRNYLSLVKFSHTLFALPFAVIGYFIAITFTKTTFHLMLFALVVLCMIFARNAAMGFNRYIDRKIDKQNDRTALREIPAGIIQPRFVLVFVIVNGLLFITTTYFINSICFCLSPVALAIILGYSLTKRFTALCHLFLGLGLSLAPIGAYLAVVGKFDWLPLFFSFAVLFWVSGFDIIYALQDEEFDRSINLRSIPVWVGKKGALILSNVFHMTSALFIIYAGVYAGLGVWYWVGAGIYCILLYYQHTLVKPNDLSKVNIAFFTTNGIASVVFAIFVLIDLFSKSV